MTEKITVTIPIDQWEKINKKVNEYNDLYDKYFNEILNKSMFFKISTNRNYEVSVETITWSDAIHDISKFEDLLKTALEKEMELKKRYEEEIIKLKDKNHELAMIYVNLPRWIRKILGTDKNVEKR